MTDCKKMRSLLDAYLDEELGEEEKTAVRRHVETCSDCSKELDEMQRTRALLSERFDTWITYAPPPPRAVLRKSQNWPVPESEGCERRSLIMKSITGIAALIIMTLCFFFFIPSDKLDASPMAMIMRASKKFLNWEEVELKVGVHLKALDFLARLSDDEEVANKPVAMEVNIVCQTPDRVLINPEGDKEGFPLVDGLTGFDGEMHWSYCEEKNEVQVGMQGAIDDSFTITINTENFKSENTIPRGMDFMKFLSWDFMKQLHTQGDKLDIKEITGPFEKRVGRRAFELSWIEEEKQVEDEEEGFLEKMMWATSRVTIDPAQDLVEQYELDVRFAFLPLVTLKVEVVDVDQGLPEDFFHYSHHIPDDIPVVEKESIEKTD